MVGDMRVKGFILRGQIAILLSRLASHLASSYGRPQFDMDMRHWNDH